MIKAIVLMFMVASACVALGQQVHYTDRDYARKPLWAAMIKDTTCNYFEAAKAFDIYFRNHDKPSTEHDQIGERAENDKKLSRKARRKYESDNAMRIEIRRYEHWRDMMLPYVQADGRILTPSERLAIHYKLQKNK
jgi:hypothetical protein